MPWDIVSCAPAGRTEWLISQPSQTTTPNVFSNLHTTDWWSPCNKVREYEIDVSPETE
jgi:hypothetical protein